MRDEHETAVLAGMVTTADLPQAEREWPGLQAFFHRLAGKDRPHTFLELVWRFEQSRTQAVETSLPLAA
jgi:hypothetical protein